MTPTMIRAEVVVERSAMVRSMLDEVRRLPLEDVQQVLDALLAWVRANPDRLKGILD